MYQAKAAGKSQYAVNDKAMHEAIVSRLQLDNELRRAIELQHFHVLYQPIVHLESGRLNGFEALVRWNSETQGIIPPNEFIPILEENGMIVQLGRWVLGEAVNAIIGHRIAEAAVHRFVIDVVTYLRSAIGTKI